MKGSSCRGPRLFGNELPVDDDDPKIRNGVPHSSYIGPLLFPIYINNLPLSIESAKVSMYTGDNSLAL